MWTQRCLWLECTLLVMNLFLPVHRIPSLSRCYQREASQVASGKEPVCQCRRRRDVGSIPGSGRSPGRGNGSPLQYSCLGNALDRGAWWASLWGRKESDTTERLRLSYSGGHSLGPLPLAASWLTCTPWTAAARPLPTHCLSSPALEHVA